MITAFVSTNEGRGERGGAVILIVERASIVSRLC